MPLPPEPRPRHFSMIRGFHLADAFTLGNAACGVGTVLMAMVFLSSHALRDFLIAAALAPAALIFDVLDGRVARWRQTHSALGREGAEVVDDEGGTIWFISWPKVDSIALVRFPTDNRAPRPESLVDAYYDGLIGTQGLRS